ncbi:MAG: threonine synthase [Hellea sp.]|nr:threonine synthase [Hellea sp.]
MFYHSLENPKNTAGFSEALLASLAPDGGLWMPDKIPTYSLQQAAKLAALSFADCAAALARPFVDKKFSDDDLQEICRDAYDYPLPLKTLAGYELDPSIPELRGDEFILELFHGPTLAFKDFAARFMGRAASHIMQMSGEKRTILVATSGDTGGAIGDAFLHQDGIQVFILFPNSGVSKVQEQQLTTIGGGNANIHAIAVDGTFDDCQQIVKDAFADEELSETFNLMSANSINVGRVIPQSFYYFWTSLQLKAAYGDKPIVYSIPSGNLGNLTGGLIARKMGAPIDRFVIGNNMNDPFVEYLASGKYSPRPSVPTLSNAMDIGRPNNFPRILDLFDGDYEAIRNVCWGASFTDEQTERHMRRIHAETGYIVCPHTSVGHMAMQAFSDGLDPDFIKVTVSTAHPGKFADSVERILRMDLDLPKPLSKAMKRKKIYNLASPTLDAIRNIVELKQS